MVPSTSEKWKSSAMATGLFPADRWKGTEGLLPKRNIDILTDEVLAPNLANKSKFLIHFRISTDPIFDIQYTQPVYHSSWSLRIIRRSHKNHGHTKGYARIILWRSPLVNPKWNVRKTVLDELWGTLTAKRSRFTPCHIIRSLTASSALVPI